MGTTFCYSLKILIRDKSVLIWSVAFPLVMSTLFFVMFTDLDELYSAGGPLPVLIVDDANYRAAEALPALVDELSGTDENRAEALLAPTLVDSEAAASQRLPGSDYFGYLLVDGRGRPQYFMNADQATGLDALPAVKQGIILGVLDRYSQDSQLVSALAERNPERLTDRALLESWLGQQSYTRQGSVTANPPSDALRYFYAVLAFGCIMMVNIGLAAVESWKANRSALGARRSLAGQPWIRSLAPVLAAAWLLGFACALVGFVYIRFAFSVSFGGKELACLAVLALSTLVSTFLGALCAAIALPGLQVAIVPIFTNLLSVFAGLYGPATQKLGDLVARELPALSAINPVRQVYEAFFSLYNYDGYGRYAQSLVTLAVMALVLFVAVLAVMRRQRYASL